MTETKNGRPHGVRYPWDEWFERGSITLIRGYDYFGPSYGFAGTARNAAAKRGIKLSVEIEESSVTITVKE